MAHQQIVAQQVLDKVSGDLTLTGSNLNPTQFKLLIQSMVDAGYILSSYFAKDVMNRRNYKNNKPLPLKLLMLNPCSFVMMECFARFSYSNIGSFCNYFFTGLQVGPW